MKTRPAGRWTLPRVGLFAALASTVLRAVTAAYEAEPLLPVVMGVAWLACVIGWFADDSGVVVPALALPFALPLGVAMVASVSYQGRTARYLGTAFAGPSVAGQTAR